MKISKPETLIERVEYLEQRVKQLEDVAMAYHGVEKPKWVKPEFKPWWKEES